MQNDPNEVNNLVTDPAHKEVLIRLRTRLEKWQMKTADPFLLRDGVSLPVIKAYVDNGESIHLPDRFDMPVDRPGSKDVEAVRWTQDDVGFSSGFWTCD